MLNSTLSSCARNYQYELYCDQGGIRKMNRIPHPVCSLTVGALMCILAAAASAHNTKRKDMRLIRGPDETLQLAFFAECNGPEDEGDASLVPPDELISFELRVVGSTPGGSTNEQIHEIEVLSWSWGTVALAPDLGELLQLSIGNFSGPGGCNKLSVTGRLAGPDGETRAHAANLLDTTEIWIIPVVNPDGY